MHELTIATEVLETVKAVAAEHKARRVAEVVLEVGALRLVVPEALEMAWQAAAEGSIAAGAALKVIEAPVAARCRGCEAKYSPKLTDFACPGCGKADAEVTGGNDIVLTSVLCETE
jgi:hydrogenase nickel incorporation protein HypA/HybF